MSLFTLRGHLSDKVTLITQIAGFIFILLIWTLVSYLELIPRSLLPTPVSVLSSFAELHYDDALLRNLFYSIKINMFGYVEAILWSLPIGFLLGLFPLFREMFRRPIDSFRFIPLTIVTGLFIAWFGIETNMKVQFLAFGIIVYLLPVVVQRIEEVDQVYCDTVFTLGANSWQTICSVFIPAVLRKIIDDIRVLVAISWTYIIVAEALNKSDGGIGALAFTCARQSRIDKVFAILLVVIGVGFIQDQIAVVLNKFIFPDKKLESA